MKNVHVFSCKSYDAVQGYTLDETGSNLPTEYCEGWVHIKVVNIDKKNYILASNPKGIIAGIQEKGYFIDEPKISITKSSD